MIAVIIMSDGDFEPFQESIRNLSSTCSDHKKVEILVKIDIPSDVSKYEKFLRIFPFAKTRVFCDERSGYNNLGLFVNELAAATDASLLFPFGDDTRVQHGDWVSEMLSTRGMFKDNIYAIRTFDYKYIACPVMSREWFNVMGYLSPKYDLRDRKTGEIVRAYGHIDIWTRLIATKIHRWVRMPHWNMIIDRSDPAKSPMPKTARMSKSIRNQIIHRMRSDAIVVSNAILPHLIS